MLAEALSTIYHDPNNSGNFGGVKRLLRRAWQFHVLGVTRKTVKKDIQSEQAYILHKPARRRLAKNHTYVTKFDAQ